MDNIFVNKEVFVNRFNEKYKLIFRHVNDGGNGLDLSNMLNELSKKRRFYDTYWKRFVSFNEENVRVYVELYLKLKK